ncbi:MAG: Hsp20/alpha crystallin family protein [Erysipelotrichales bacterium]|nr:Hsp20/alpha crystallin family protein [Erysipelotrichales bacterium]MBQ1386638.1 Hsp20/alpha crystallin family protein [Erysipelotrichales bacterium]MBQ4375799.1 Hsp20/alpha crystallin family protein [Erysipelotrichales bacterium]MBQ5541896.1 Hsp20/alpha crystallin family protein [Erysipelotrichales bacterium]
MLVPSIFGENLFDDWMDDWPVWTGFENRADRKLYGKHANRVMLTDVHDKEDHYEVMIDLPGFKKEEITLQLKDGYLTVTASKGLDEEEKDKKGTVVRQERYAGTMSRSFYVGENMTKEDIKAKYEDGVLHLNVPKKEEKTVPEITTIDIE